MKMNMIKNCLIATLAAAAVPFAALAVGDKGDIRSIDLVPQTSTGITYPNSESPLKEGQQVWILVRLLNEDYALTMGGGTPHPWYFKAYTPGSTFLADALYTPKLGISVGGQARYATYSSTGPNGELSGQNLTVTYYTDLYFCYTVQAGDLGLPIKLLNKNGTIPQTDTESADFLLVNATTAGGLISSVWKLGNDYSDNLASFHYGPQNPSGSPSYPSSPWTILHRNFYMPTGGATAATSGGAYVQSIDFDDNMDEESGSIWRYVYPSGSTDVVLHTPAISGSGPTTVYVWSDDETVFTPYPADGNTSVILDVDGRKVLPVTIASGATEGTFRLKGGTAAEGTSANIVLCASTRPELDAVGTEVPGTTLKRTVQMTAAPKPKVTLRMDGSEDKVSVVCPTTEYSTPVATLTARIYPTVDHDIVVTLKADSNGKTLADLFDDTIIGLSTEEGGDAYTGQATTITIPANTSYAQLYVYGLGWNNYTVSSKKGITFSIDSIDDATIEKGSGCKLYIDKVSPKIVAIDPGYPEGDVSAVSGVQKEFLISVEDCYKNIKAAEDGAEYLFSFDSSDGEELEDMSATLEAADFSVYQTFYQQGTKTITVKAVAPGTGSGGTGATSLGVSFDLEVGKAKSIEASVPGITPWKIAEGGTLPVTFALTGGTLSKTAYAFLVPKDADAGLYINTNGTPFAKGVAIGKGTSDGTFKPDLSFLDGTKALEFTVRFSSSETDPTKKVSGFEDGTLFITVTNRLPYVTSLTAGGLPVENGGTYGDGKKSVPKGVPTAFSLTAWDVDADLNAVAPNQFKVKWVIYDGEAKEYETLGNPSGQKIEHEFLNDTIGAQGALVQVFLKDKDTSDYPAVPDYTFRVPVADTPRVTLALATTYDGGVWPETEANQHGVVVALSVAAKEALELRVKAPKKSDGGYIKFKEVSGRVEVEDADQGWYKVTLPAGALSQTLSVTEMDGTDETAAGIDIDAEVTTDTPSGYGTKTWKEYYEAATPLTVKVTNEAPIPTVPSADDESYTNETTKAYSPFYLSYRVGSDVPADFLKAETGKGITVVLSSDGTDLETITDLRDKDKHSFTKPVEFTSSGVHFVTVTFTDKDGSSYVRKLVYNVLATKTLVVSAHGPAAAMTAPNGHSMRYKNNAAGLGAGRVYGLTLNAQAVKAWRSTFSVAVTESDLQTVAKGYTIADPIDPMVDPDGTYPNSSGTYYNYATQHPAGIAGLDSFFYAWICDNTKDSDGLTISSPLMVGPAAQADYPIPLQSYEADKKAYDNQYWEALFSHEKYATDNCGDINGDGIPDVAVMKFGYDVVDVSQMTVTGDDLKDISELNPDEDYLPNTVSAAYASFIPDLADTWVTAGLAFDSLTELRGWGAGLNDALEQLDLGSEAKPERKYVDPDLDDTSTLAAIEWIAYTNWCADASRDYDPTDPTHWTEWSPERPTNPMEADTDGDGLPDGYEYWVWYRAHVGFIDSDGSYKRLTGRRFVPAHPLEPTVISSDTIASAYDPRVKNKTLSEADTDNDGLTDLVEFALGTNPFDFDTDGDGLPDGYENLIVGTDPLMYATDKVKGDGTLNTDGDSMAFIQYVDLSPDGPDMRYYVIPVEGGYICSSYENPLATEEKEVSPGVTNTVIVPLGDGVPVYRAWLYAEANETAKTPREFCRGREMAKAATYKDLKVTGEMTREVMDVIHFDVYREAAFDPRTGWNVSPALAGHLINSRAFTHRDEFLTQAFFYHMGGLEAADLVPTTQKPWTYIWATQTTNPTTADTDADNMPDGWELYLMSELGNEAEFPEAWETGTIESHSPYYMYSPIVDFSTIDENMRDTDGDGLDWPHEFCGYESCQVYANCETIENVNEDWQNKWWPTDPRNGDTDGDGLSDGEEGGVFIYGTAVHSAIEDCVPGGGLNPLSWDTDCDGLPDPWEAEFAGTATEGDVSTTTSVDANGTTNTTVSVSSAVWNNDGMDGTVDDAKKDYDLDGLANWQEYMVGAMRCWRYDDSVSVWTSHKVTEDELAAYTDSDWYNILVNPESPKYNPGFRNEHFDLGVYFSCAKNPFEIGAWTWEPGKETLVNAHISTPYAHFYMFKDGIDHDLRLIHDPLTGDNRFTRGRPRGDGYYPYNSQGLGIWPLTYICCDPINYDTDYDGLDDYYELFHGLNPLLGEDRQMRGSSLPPRDVIYEAYYKKGDVDNPWSAMHNSWIDGSPLPPLPRPDRELHLKGKTGSQYDFFQFPWLAGMAMVDPDGDNIRNQQEGIMANLQAAATYLHTDPTPLWMTDSSYGDSLSYRYYQVDDPEWAEMTGINLVSLPSSFVGDDGVVYTPADFPWLAESMLGYVNYYGSMFNWWCVDSDLYNYEENEGYDSDHDFLSDFEEAQGKTKSASDPQRAESPVRRQAMWFGGDNDKGFLQTPPPIDEQAPYMACGSEYRQNFLYYTVECWAKADPSTVNREKLQTLVERAIWTGAANAADEKYLRKNFLIGLKGGRWYTMFDSTGTDAKQCVEITDGPQATTNWTHIAATYDGTALRLYVNGVCRVSKTTNIQPEHGVQAVTINDGGELRDGRLSWSSYPIAVIVGASANNSYALRLDFQWHNRNSSRVSDTNPMGLYPRHTTMSDYDNFFCGYIDEVRIWDGARDSNVAEGADTPIKTDYENRTRYTAEMAIANRNEVYASWRKGGRRSPITDEQLPAELMFHWSFDNVPGATKTADVLKTPAGFSTAYNVTDAMAKWQRPDGWTNCWWVAIDETLRSKVYTDKAWVPWIAETIGHLPRFDQTTLDSVFWSANYAGYTAAADAGNGYTLFTFPRTGEVPTRWRQMIYTEALGVEGDPWTTDTRWLLAVQDSTMAAAYRFTQRNKLSDGFDLLPLGNAYPKRISSAEGGMWDDNGAADAWAEVGEDADNNGLPDWWEAYALDHYCDELEPGSVLTWSTTVNYNGIRMPAYRAYLRDVAKGMLTDGKYHSEYADTTDSDGDGMPDWWEDLYGIDTGSVSDANADPDCDGLSNIQEYKISEVYGLYNLNPTLAYTGADQSETDYFLQVTEEMTAKAKGYKRLAEGAGQYLGEVFADHDYLEDTFEPDLGTDRTLYDAYSDKDEDGWSAFSELRYSKFKMSTAAKFLSHLAGEEEVRDAPVPVIHATLRYNGTKAQNSTNAIYVLAYSGNNLQKEPTAKFAIVPGSQMTRHLYLGQYENRTFHGTLTPGWVINSFDKISLQCAHAQPNDKWSWIISGQNYRGTYAEMYAAYLNYGSSTNFSIATAGWSWADVIHTSDSSRWLQTSADDKTMKGKLLMNYEQAGDIDLVTGDFSLDVSSLADLYMEGKTAMDQYFFRIEYVSQIPALQQGALKVSLASPDEGTLTEGTTAFAAFLDADGDGAFTPGVDPIGFVKDVAVGWDKVPSMVIEMTDSSQAAGLRFAYGSDATTVRIIRTTMNGKEQIDGSDVKRRIVYSRSAADMTRNSVYEGDLVTGEKFGLDWSYLKQDIDAMTGVTAKDITEVGYTIVKTAGSIQNIDPDTVITNFTVSYAAEAAKPTCVSPSEKSYGIVETQCPTFTWTASDGYTAFRLQILDASGSEILYCSPLSSLPARDGDSQYVWTAPVYVGARQEGDTWSLDNNSNYCWRVALYNAKFSDTNDVQSVWSDKAKFSTALAESNDGSTTYGCANVSVRYFGPDTNALSDVIVQLYENADFTGSPAAQTRLAATNAPASSLTNAMTVTFRGLASGDYYACAFIDRKQNVSRDKFESWGYAAQIGVGKAAIWTPVAVTVNADSSKIKSAAVIIEDTDINQNDVLDVFDDLDVLETASATTGGGSDTSDTDGDGLTYDVETSDTYTDPQKWDTDGDGMPDGWEAKFAGTDALLEDADTVADGDVMAYIEVSRTLVYDANGTKYLYGGTNDDISVGDTLKAKELVTTYDYVKVYGTGTNVTTKTLCGVGTNLVTGADFKIDKIETVTAVLVHAQVYDAYGYDVNTCVPGSGAVNTVPFTALDKYMVVRYLSAIGVKGVDEEQMNKKGLWSSCTLKPGDTDCDRDGMADGWELYMMFGTNKTAVAQKYTTATAPISPWKYADARETSPGGEGLTNLEEYHHGDMPTDPWSKYSLYSILSEKGILLEGTVKFADNEARRFRLGVDDYEKDDDGDLIKNLNEFQAYLLDRKSLDDLSSTNAWSNGFTPDYFRAGTNDYYGAFYLGQLFNGSEFIEPTAREALDLIGLSMVGTRDYFQSGWDVWSIVRYNATKNESADAETKYANYLIKFLTLRYGEEFTGTTEAEAIEFYNQKSGKELETAEACVNDAGGIDYIKSIIAENSTSTLTADGYEVPAPTLYLTLKYAGNDSQPLVVEAYQTSSTYPEYGEQMVARWSQNVLFDAGIAYAKLEVPGKGTLKQGKTRIVAYFDVDGTSGYTAGDTYGTTTINVGYLGASATIRMGEANPDLPVLMAQSNECSVVAFVRSAINGVPLYNQAAGVYYCQRRNNTEREAIYPDEYLSSTFAGIDSTLAENYKDTLSEIESVTYEVLHLPINKLSLVNVTNLNHYALNVSGKTTYVDQSLNEEFTVKFSNIRDVASNLAWAGSTADDWSLAFSVPTDGFANTRFWLRINGEIVTPNQGWALLRMASGRVILDKAWFQEKGIADKIKVGEVNTFSVLLGNDKFGLKDASWPKAAEFYVGEGASYTGRIAVDVRHPLTNFVSGVTIAVYEKEDLATPFKTVTGCKTETPVEITGLREGSSYYVAAWYVKNVSDGRTSAAERLPYDTWGYQTALGISSNGFAAVAIQAKRVASVTNAFWMQDTDWNDNGIVDRAEEMLAKSVTAQPGVTPGRTWKIVDAQVVTTETVNNDVMAYAAVTLPCVATVINNDEVWFVIRNLDVESTPDKISGGIPVGTDLSELDTLMATYWYDYPASSTLALGTNVVASAYAGYKVTRSESKAVALVHAQVYDWFGFCTNTANASVLSTAWVNTKVSTSDDCKFVTNYLAHVCGVADSSRYALPGTSNDADADGVCDGWELYVMFGPAGTGKTGWYHSPWNYGDRTVDVDNDGLDQLHEYDGGYQPTDPWNKDTFSNGLGDKFVQTYDVKDGDFRKDLVEEGGDNDQLSNFIEGMISSMDGFQKLDAHRMATAGEAYGGNQLVPDYFLCHGSLYLGEMFTDHDMIEDWWEDQQPTELELGGTKVANYSRYVYDANRDSDGDGWTNWQEARAAIDGPTTNVWEVLTDDQGNTYSNLVEKALYDVEGRPTPTIDCAIYYNGKRGNLTGKMIVVKAWKQADYNDLWAEGQPDAVWQFPAENEKPLQMTHTLGIATNGYLRSGRYLFAAYVTDGGFEVDPTMPFGVRSGIEVSYLQGAPFSIELTDTNPSVLRIDVVKSLARQATFATEIAELTEEDLRNVESTEAWKTYVAALNSCYEDVASLYTDRGQSPDSLAALTPPIYIGTNTVLKLSNVTVRVVRAYINGKPYTDGANEITDVVLERTMPLATRPVFSELEVAGDYSLDLDWNTLNDAISKASLDRKSVTNVTYHICVGDYSTAYDERGNNLAVSWISAFEAGKQQTPVSDMQVSIAGGRPTFSWTHAPSIDKAYPAFRLRVWKKGDKDARKDPVYDSQAQSAPARNKDGRYVFTAPVYPGMMGLNNEVLDLNTNYEWAVSMLDAKFTKPADVEELKEFSFGATGATSDYGDIAVAVKYMGPGLVSTNTIENLIRVEAYTTADFSGEPAGVGFVANTETIAASNVVALNAMVRGLPKDKTYYVRAYLDTTGNALRDEWETWGYANYVGTEQPNVYSPREIAFTDEAHTPECVIYLEDADTNHNQLPDVWEWNKDGELAGYETTAALSATATPAPYIVTLDQDDVVSTNLWTILNTTGAVQLPYYSTLTKFVNGGSLSSASLALAMAGIDLEDLETKPEVTITSFSLTDGITFAVDPRTTVNGETLVPKAIKVKVTLSLQLEHTAALNGAWSDIGDPITETFTINETETISSDTLNAKIKEELDKHSSSGFFRVKVSFTSSVVE